MCKANPSKNYWEYWAFWEISRRKTSVNFEPRLRRSGFHFRLHQWLRVVFRINYYHLVPNLPHFSAPRASWRFFCILYALDFGEEISRGQLSADLTFEEGSHKIQARKMRKKTGVFLENKVMGNHPKYCSLSLSPPQPHMFKPDIKNWVNMNSKWISESEYVPPNNKEARGSSLWVGRSRGYEIDIIPELYDQSTCPDSYPVWGGS